MSFEFLTMLALAFAGGVFLNVMPCVLPVLTMKVFHLIEHADSNPREHRMHGIAYALGVVGTLVVAGILVVSLRESMRVMWGSQFQSPQFMAGIVALLLVFGWNAVGLFEFSPSLSVDGGKSRYLDSFVNGVVASIMATPCTGPGVAAVAGYAFAADRPAWQTLVVFASLGAGLASPFVLVSFVPAIGRMLPRPGAWMDTFKKLMGLSLLGAAAFFFGVLMHQVSTGSAGRLLMFFFVLSSAAWAYGHFATPFETSARRWVIRVVLAGLLVVSGTFFLRFEAPSQAGVNASGFEAVVGGQINWQPFTPGLVAAAREANRPVFVDYTAEWCANCKTNERLFIEVATIRDTLTETGVLPVKADLTNEDPLIWDWLDELGRAGIPVYAIYMPDGTYDLLPTVINTELLDGRLRAAAERFPASNFTEIAYP
jgi:thiol:disulfide interchange protein DsbD